MTDTTPKILAFALLSLTLSALSGCESSPSIVPMRDIQQIEYDNSTQPATAQAAIAATATAPATMADTQSSTQPGTIPTTLTTIQPTSLPATSTAADTQTTPATLAATAPATAPATLAATQPASAPTTQPLAKKVKFIDPNQTVRYIYRASYDRIWQEAMEILVHMNYRIDRQDYRLGVMTTLPNPSGTVAEPWRPDQVGIMSAIENTVNRQQRHVRLTIKNVEGKPDFYEIAVQVLVERMDNPPENIVGESFATGSGFGREPLALRSDFALPPPETPSTTTPPSTTPLSTTTAPAATIPAQVPTWYTIGHDIKQEKKILDRLFDKI